MQSAAAQKFEAVQTVTGSTNSVVRTAAPIVCIAVLAALLHIAPNLAASHHTPAGWTFTGNLSTSPDVMQYRVWIRLSQKEGILVSNTFTTEKNKPHLLVIFYYVIGQLSRLLAAPSEWVLAFAGCAFAFAFVICLYQVCFYFLKSAYERWWAFFLILTSGGIGGYVELLSNIDSIRTNRILSEVFFDRFRDVTLFERYRANYVFLSLFDTHYLLVWLIATTALLSLFFTLKRSTPSGLLLTAFLFLGSTLLHIYEGATLLVITWSVLFLFWRKGLLSGERIQTGLVCSMMTLAGIALQLFLYGSSGLPFPSWRGPNVLASILLISYPVAWFVIGWGLKDYWEKAHFNECFLLGWALGCTALTLSGPFYTYPDRGTMTLQIPIYLIAASIYFSRYRRVTPLAGLVIVVLLGATPVWALQNWWELSKFDQSRPAVFLNSDHREIIDILRKEAGPEDVLVVDKSRDPWLTDDLWLVPEYAGKLYCAHFFLTVDYERKRAEVARFFAEKADQQEKFLRERRIRYVFVRPEAQPERFLDIKGIRLRKAGSVGSLFEFSATTSDVRS